MDTGISQAREQTSTCRVAGNQATLGKTSSRSTFAFTPKQLSTLHSPKNLDAFFNFGGLQGLESGLRTNRFSGLNEDEMAFEPFANFDSEEAATSQPFAERRSIFDNPFQIKKQQTVWKFLWLAYKDLVLFLLTAAAVASLAIGLYESLSTSQTAGQASNEWAQGFAVIVAILFVVFTRALAYRDSSRRIQKMNRGQIERDVEVMRSARPRLISISDVLVGDVLFLTPGDIVPADGILISGHNVTCDESAATGESEPIRKKSGDIVFDALVNNRKSHCFPLSALDPFILSGSKVVDGTGMFLVTSIGLNSAYNKIISALQDDSDPTILQKKLGTLAKYIASTGLVVAMLLFATLFIKFLAGLAHNSQSTTERVKDFVETLILPLTILVVAVPAGLLLPVTLSLSLTTTRMLKDNILVRQRQACETLGTLTRICTDKTGTLTGTGMVVVAGMAGQDLELRFQNPMACTSSDSNLPSARTFIQILARDFESLLVDSIVLNTNAFEAEDGNSFVGNNTEVALLDFIRENIGLGPVQLERSSRKVTQIIPFNSLRQCMAVVVELPDSKTKYRVFIKGASEVLLAKCSSIVKEPSKDCNVIELSAEDRQSMARSIEAYSNSAYRTISLAYRDFFPPMNGVQSQRKNVGDQTNFSFEFLLQELVFLAVFGIHNPLQPGVAESLRACKEAGMAFTMLSGDNIHTARSIAIQAGIISENDPSAISLEAAQFRALSREDASRLLPNIAVLARSSPEDKREVVTMFKDFGEVVALTGDGVNDVLALRAADVGFSMGYSGAEVANAASSITLMDSNFGSIVKAIMWGRGIHDSVKKFLEFQMVITITSILLTFISTMASLGERPALTAAQLMWINIFLDFLAAIALVSDPPQAKSLNRRPGLRNDPPIDTTMWKIIIGQSIYQLTVILVIHFKCIHLLSYQTELEAEQLQTLVFNTYSWMQIFNLYNCREWDNSLDIWRDPFRNLFFLVVSAWMIGTQTLVIFTGGSVFSVVRLTGLQWCLSIVFGFATLPVGSLLRCIPDQMVHVVITYQWFR